MRIRRSCAHGRRDGEQRKPEAADNRMLDAQNLAEKNVKNRHGEDHGAGERYTSRNVNIAHNRSKMSA